MKTSTDSPQKINRLTLLSQGIRAYQQGRFGDAAAYKTAILGIEAYPQIATQLLDLEHCFLQIDLQHLSGLPLGSFGKAYSQYMEFLALKPLSLTPSVTSQLQQHALGIRYLLTHDIFHLLLGYDTSLKGELAVWAFVGEQRYSPGYEKAAKLASIVYPCWQPYLYRQFRAIAAEGRERARQASCLITQPFEQFWSEPLDKVRDRFGLGHKVLEMGESVLDTTLLNSEL